MVDTTALDGSIDAVAASLLDEPQKEDQRDEDLEQPEEGDAIDQTDAAEDDTAAPEGDETDETDDVDPSDAEEDAPAEQLFTVKVNGREQQVPLSELLRGYSGQAYIQQRMQEVATARKEAEDVYSALQSERQQIANLARQVQTGAVPMQPPTPPDEALLQRDPIGYLEARVKFDKDVAAYQQAQAAMQEQVAQADAAMERARVAHLREQHALLTQAIPAFAKPDTAAKIRDELIRTGIEDYGYAAEELKGVTDHRALRVLYDAAQYRRLMSGKARAEKQAEQPKTPTIRPGAKVTPQAGKKVQAEKVKAQMKRTGSVDDVARFLLS